MRIEPEITGVLIELTPTERRLLATLLAKYDELVHDQLEGADLEGAGIEGDPALTRLFPNAYPDDDEAAAEFRHYTRDSLVERKTANSGLIAAALQASDGDRLAVERGDAEHWLPALTDLRLVLAERLGIHDDGDRVPEGELGDVYEWLGELQGSLVDALD
jgi:hypothetical protein